MYGVYVPQHQQPTRLLPLCLQCGDFAITKPIFRIRQKNVEEALWGNSGSCIVILFTGIKAMKGVREKAAK
jgi:hypothetical protein